LNDLKEYFSHHFQRRKITTNFFINKVLLIISGTNISKNILKIKELQNDLAEIKLYKYMN